ncbi:MAG: metallophosphoesterase [Fibrobacteres bacterium]|nr:metallophosphoesterase [Fibrobacterota bacterium]
MAGFTGISRFGIPLLSAFLFAGRAHALHFAAYGDTRTNPDTHQLVINAISKVDPELVIFSGDLWDGYGLTTEASQAKFKSVLTKNANIAALLEKNLYLVARGNHETEAELLSFQPSLVRGGKPVYAFTQGNCFFISLSMDPLVSLAFLETQLQSAEAKKADWKFVFSHYPVYSTGDHGAQGLPDVERICDKYGVNVVFNGHDHMYERTNQIYAGKVVDTTSRLTSSKGTVYIVSGGGGAPLYPVGRQWWTRFSKSVNNFCEITADASLMTVTARTPDGKALDSFTLSKITVPLAEARIRKAPLLLDIGDVASQRMAILAFEPAPAADAWVEIRAADGSLLKRETLTGGQTSWAWDYSKAGQGDYVAVLKAGAASSSRTISVAR